jgi:hypothetical protein
LSKRIDFRKVNFTYNREVKSAVLADPLTLPAYRALFRKRGQRWQICIEGHATIIIDEVRDAIIAVMLMRFSMGEMCNGKRQRDPRLMVLF